MSSAGRALLSLVVGQVFLHSAMAGLRLAVPDGVSTPSPWCLRC